MRGAGFLVASELERKAERLLFDEVKKEGGLCVKLAPLNKGNPDRLVLLGGIYLVELKRPGGALSLTQRAWHIAALKAGVKVHVVIGTLGVHSWMSTVRRVRANPNDKDALDLLANTKEWWA